MASDVETVQDDASRGPPAGVKVTPIPPPTIPFSPTGSPASGPATTPTPQPTQPPAAPTSAPATTPSTPTAAASATAPFAAAPPSPSAAAAAASVAAPSPAPLSSPPPSSIPQKRALADEDHTPAVRSPLNPDSRTTPKLQTPQEDVSAVMGREKRTKKESLKKRESKAALAAEAAAARGAPDTKRKEKEGAAATNGATAANTLTSTNHADTANGHANGVKPEDLLPVRVRLAGPLRPSDFEQPATPIFRAHHSIKVPDGEEVDLVELYSEHSSRPVNRRGYVYESGIADPRFPSLNYFRQTDAKPYHAHISFEDAPPNVLFGHWGLHVSGEAGFRTARANVAVRQGRWYWECKVTRGIVKESVATDGADGTTATAASSSGGGGGGEPESHGHVRIGWARREASRDAPVGYDAYGYGIRDRKGQRVHMSRPKECLIDGADLCEGDVLGLEIQLPSEALHRKVVQGTYNPAADLLDDDTEAGDVLVDGPNVVRDRIPFRFQTSKLVFEKFDYHPIKELEDLANPAPTLSASSAGATEPPNPTHPVPCLRTLPGSWIRVYKNGVLQGTPFTNLLAFLPPASTTNAKMQEGARERLDDGTLGYYPAVSLFRGGAVETNFGPDFWYPPPGYAVPRHGEDSPAAAAAAAAATIAANGTLMELDDGAGGLASTAGGGIDDDVMMVEVGDDRTADARPLTATTAVDETATAAPQITVAGGDRNGFALSGAPLAPPPLTRIRPVGERYEEQIAEDIVYDIVDEVYFWMLDGGKTQSAAAGAAGGDGGHGTTAVARAAAAESSKDVTMDGT